MAVQTSLITAKVDNLPELLELMQEYYAYDELEFSKTTALAALRDLLAEPVLGRIWLICRDNLIIGYVALTFGYSLEFGGRDAFVDELFIQEGHRGRGIGTEALELVKSAAKAIGIGALHLEVERGNKKALRFYRSSGFEDRDRFHLMSKRL
jgi:GNAT superfamily N-acetyltransferase